jgi:hypothetical protein
LGFQVAQVLFRNLAQMICRERPAPRQLGFEFPLSFFSLHPSRTHSTAQGSSAE